MTFRQLSQYLEKLEKTTSRIAITQILAEAFTKADDSEIDKIVYLLLGRLAPNYQNIVFNLAEKMMLKAVSQALLLSRKR